MKIRLLITAITAAMVFLALITTAGADHAWSGYHWPSDKLSPTVVNKTASPLYDVPAATAEWAALGAPIQPTMSVIARGNITVSEASSVFWLGLARVFVDDTGHITKGEVKLNTKYIAYYEANGYLGAADHVLCQEIGHVLGLDHNRDGLSGGFPDDTCMNDQARLGQYTSPNGHDAQQLSAIYSHTDTGGGPGGKGKKGNRVWITVHVFWPDDLTRIRAR